MTATAILSRRHWVFDLDGTLTLPVHDFAAIRTALAIPDGCDILDHLASLPPGEARKRRALLDTIEDDLIDRTSPAPGVVRLVTHLERRGVRLGILTRNSRTNAMRILQRIGIDSCFPPESVLGRDEALPKPDPDGLHKLAGSWGTRPRSMVMVGDYLYDLLSGRAAGTATIHVDTTRAFRWPEQTDITVASLEELMDKIEHAAFEQPR